MTELDLTPIKDRLAKARHLPVFLTEGDIAIAKAHEDIVSLIAEVERLRKENEELRKGYDLVKYGAATGPMIGLAINDAAKVLAETEWWITRRENKRLHTQLDAAQSLHRKMPVYDILMDDCHEHDSETHGFEAMDGEWYCDQHISFYTCLECYSDFVDKDYLPVYPCPTIRALGGEQG